MDSFFLQEETEEEKKNLDKSRASKTNVIEDVCMLQMSHVIFSLTWHNCVGGGRELLLLLLEKHSGPNF